MDSGGAKGAMPQTLPIRQMTIKHEDLHFMFLPIPLIYIYIRTSKAFGAKIVDNW